MNITPEKFNELEKKGDFAKWSSWAIWNNEKPKDLTIINEPENVGILHTNFVIIGLNPSERKDGFSLNEENWANFHGGSNDKKLYNAFYKTSVWGAYMTDLINKRVTKGNDIDEMITSQDDCLDINKQIKGFREKLVDVNVTKDTIFILLGRHVKQYFNFFVNDAFGKNKRIHLHHYSEWGKNWVVETKEAIKKYENGKTNT